MYALILKEVRSFLSSLIGYIVISVFLLLTGLFLWVFDIGFNIMESGFAELDPLFNFAPFVFLFLIPAITMRSFAEEKRTGTLELLLTRPLTDLQIIIAKYIGGFVLVLFSLLPTLIYYYSISELSMEKGNLDDGAIWGSYLGLLLLGAVFVAIGIFASAVAQNQIVAFLIGIFLCFFFYLGFNFIGSYSAFGSLDTFILNLGIFQHYESISRGVVDTRDLLYYFSVIALFIVFTKVVLESRRKFAIPQALATISIIVLLNFIGGFKFFRLDLTSEKRHSLSESTVNFLENKLDDVAHFTIYLAGDLPADLKKVETGIREKLDEMIAYAGNNIQYEFVDPNEIEDENEREEFMYQLDKEKKIRYSMIEMVEKGKVTLNTLFTGATVKYGDNEISFNFLIIPFIRRNDDIKVQTDAAYTSIEFTLMDALRKVTRQVKPRIALLEGHGEADMHQTAMLYSALIDYYAVERVSINNQVNAIRDYNAVIIVQPDSAFSEKDKFVIDQFIMKGGKVAWFIDPMEVRRDTLFTRGQTFGLSKELRLDDQLFTYGVRLNKNIILDKTCAPIGVPGYEGEFHEWCFFPLLTPERDHAITRSVNPVKVEYASSIDLVGDDPEIKKTVLLKTSAYNTFYNSPARINYGVIEMGENLFRTTKPELPVAVMLEGKFKSVFTNRLAPEFLNSKDYVFKEKSENNRMLVVADGDIAINEVSYKEVKGQIKPLYLPLHVDKYGIRNPDGSPRYIYGNREFLLNAIDYLLGDADLIEVRQRTITIRRLNEELVIAEKRKWQIINIAVPVILMILFGLLQNYLRKRKYAF